MPIIRCSNCTQIIGERHPNALVFRHGKDVTRVYEPRFVVKECRHCGAENLLYPAEVDKQPQPT